jgi:hypothetical protein
VRKSAGSGTLYLGVVFYNQGSLLVSSGTWTLANSFSQSPGAVLPGAVLGGGGTLSGVLDRALNWTAGSLTFDLTIASNGESPVFVT